MKRVGLKLGDSVQAEIALDEQAAPATVAALWDTLPIVDRAIQARWSGNAWRTEKNYELLPKDAPIENITERLVAGDVIYYPNYEIGLIKIAVCYGQAQWLGPYMLPRKVAKIGTVDAGLDELIAASKRLIYDGAATFELSRLA
jgi:hypothetical protein